MLIANPKDLIVQKGFGPSSGTIYRFLLNKQLVRELSHERLARFYVVVSSKSETFVFRVACG